MNDFSYFVPETLKDALVLLDKNKNGDDLKILNGGTDLVLELYREETNPSSILNIRKLKELNFIEKEDQIIKIGGIVTLTEILENDIINNNVPILSLACQSVGSTQIRNLGTISGNILTAAPSADTVPALIALNAKAILKSINGSREVEIEKILEGPHKTAIKNNEILTEVFFKVPDNKVFYSGYRKLGRRQALAISRMSVAIAIEKDSLKYLCKDARIALGAVAENPFRAKGAEDILKNKKYSQETIKDCINEISNIAAKKLGNRPSAPFKKEAIKGVAGEVLLELYKKMNK